MPTFKSEFQSLAKELINVEFADFQRPFVIKGTESYDVFTDTYTTFEAQVGAIPIDLKTAERVFSNVTADEIYFVIVDDAPVPDNFDASYTCNYDGTDYDINQVARDPADAAYFIRIVI
jgi:hypothetical protein